MILHKLHILFDWQRSMFAFCIKVWMIEFIFMYLAVLLSTKRMVLGNKCNQWMSSDDFYHFPKYEWQRWTRYLWNLFSRRIFAWIREHSTIKHRVHRFIRIQWICLNFAIRNVCVCTKWKINETKTDNKVTEMYRGWFFLSVNPEWMV